MRPYLAVLKDSFREAFASRILWFVIIATTVVLVLAAPAGLKEEKTSRLSRTSVRNWATLVAKIDKERRTDGPSPGRQIWNRLSAELKGLIEASQRESAGEVAGEVPPPLMMGLVEELNDMLYDRTLYDAQAWQATEPNEEAAELLRRGVSNLGGDELSRLNRLLLRSAYPAEISREEGAEIYISYFTFRPVGPLPLSRAQVTPIIQRFLALIVDYVVGVFAVFAAILVTASIIPQMFEPGAIDLLLSKPVLRSLLFLTKFVGGCAFIGLNAAYFILGLWLIAGSRFGIWSHKLFLCIPILLFLFAIYYSVSALAGVLWRNAIVSVIVSILFWAGCFLVWFAKTAVESQWIDPERLVKLIPAGQTLVAATEQEQLRGWRPGDSTWYEVFAGDPPGPGGMVMPKHVIGPVYDARLDRILTIEAPPGGGGFGMFGPPSTLWVGTRAGGWVRTKGTAPPSGAIAMFDSPHGEIIVVTRGTVYRLKANAAGKDAKSSGKNEKFVRSGPEPALRLDPSAGTAMNPDTGAIATYSQGVVTVLDRDDSGKYVRKIEKEIVVAKDAKPGLIAWGGKTLVVALSDGRVLVVDAADLEMKHTFHPAGKKPPRFAASAAGGRWLSVLFHNRVLWLYDARNEREANFSFRGQGNISAAIFDGPDRLLTADRGRRVTEYQLDPFRVETSRAEAMGKLEAAYYYGLIPLYTIFPKPGELGEAVKYLLSDSQADALDPNSQNLAARRDSVDVAGPVWSSLAFLAVMLTLSCLYVWRSDF